MLRTTLSRVAPLLAVLALAGCGQDSKADLIPQSEAKTLLAELADVRSAIDNKSCSEARAQAQQFSESVDNLSPAVDADLRRALRNGAQKLASQTEGGQCLDETGQTDTSATETAPTAAPAPAPEPTPAPTPTPEPTPDTGGTGQPNGSGGAAPDSGTKKKDPAKPKNDKNPSDGGNSNSGGSGGSNPSGGSGNGSGGAAAPDGSGGVTPGSG